MKNNFNIAIVCNTVMKTSETFITRHIQELAPGHTVVLTFDEYGSDKLNCPVHYINATKYQKIPWFLRKPITAYKLFVKGQANPLLSKDLQSIYYFLKKHQVKVILVEYGHLADFIKEAAQKLNIPLYVYFWGGDASRRLKNWRVRYAYHKLFPKITGIICASNALYQNLKAAGFSHPNTHIISPGVNIEKFTPSNKQSKNMILAAGRFVEKKAPHKTIKAFALIANKYPNVRLEMIGEGELLPKCRQIANDLGIEEKVIFHGDRNHEFVRRKMEEASIFVQHSVTSSNGDMEGLPTAIQEAMACGLPVVSTNHSGIPDAVIDGETGFLVEEHNVENMGNKIDKLLSNSSLRDKMGKAGRERAVQQFSTVKLLNKLRGILGLPTN